MVALKWDGELHQASDITIIRGLIERGENLPVRHLSSLGHAQEFQAVEGFGVLEVGLHEFGDFCLGLSRLLGDGGPHTVS